MTPRRKLGYKILKNNSILFYKVQNAHSVKVSAKSIEKWLTFTILKTKKMTFEKNAFKVTEKYTLF